MPRWNCSGSMGFWYDMPLTWGFGGTIGALKLNCESGSNEVDSPEDCSSYEHQLNQYARKCEELGRNLAEAQAYADRCTVIYLVNVFANVPQVASNIMGQCLASILQARKKSIVNLVVQVCALPCVHLTEQATTLVLI
jgi:hypothetical protein